MSLIHQKFRNKFKSYLHYRFHSHAIKVQWPQWRRLTVFLAALPLRPQAVVRNSLKPPLKPLICFTLLQGSLSHMIPLIDLHDLMYP